MDEIKKQLGYNPDIQYEENYYSNFNNSSNNIISIPSTTNNLSSTIDHINNMLNGIPSDLANAIAEIYEPIKNLYDNYLKDKIIESVPPYKQVDITKPIPPPPPPPDPPIPPPPPPPDPLPPDPPEPPDDDEYARISLNKSLIILKEKEERQLYHTISPASLKNKEIAWSSTYEDIATVKDGLVTGIKKGSCEVSVTLIKHNKKASCKVIVVPESSPIDPPPSGGDPEDKKIPIKRIELSYSFIEIYVNEEFKLKVNIYPDNATNKEVVWSSTDESIATVVDGLVKGIEIGQCRVVVTSKDGNKKAYCYVTVKEDESKHSPEDDPIVGPGDKDDDDDDGLWETGEIPTITVTKPDEREIIEKEFIKNIYDLIDYYMKNLNKELSKYYYQVLKITTNLSNEEVKILFNDISNSNNSIKTQLQHLFDLSLKNVRISNVKLNYLENNFNINQTVLHTQSFLAIYEMRKKYVNIKMLDSTTKENSEANHILKSLKLDYDVKYDKTYFNLFRYVNSSLKITSDVINNTIQSYNAKGLLIKKGGLK